MYGFKKRNVVISKRSSGIWAGESFPEWFSAIQAAVRTYEGNDTPADKNLLQVKMESYLKFALEYIDEYRAFSDTDLN